MSIIKKEKLDLLNEMKLKITDFDTLNKSFKE